MLKKSFGETKASISTQSAVLGIVRGRTSGPVPLSTNQWRRHGANGATCPLPQPPIGHPVRSMQIRGDFHVEKNGGRLTLTGFAPTFYMNPVYGGRSLVLRLRKRGGCKSCWSYFGKPSVKLRGPLGSFSPGIGPPGPRFLPEGSC